MATINSQPVTKNRQKYPARNTPPKLIFIDNANPPKITHLKIVASSFINTGEKFIITDIVSSDSLYEIQQIALCGTAHLLRRELSMRLKNITPKEATNNPYNHYLPSG